MSVFSERLKNIRARRGMSQADLAHLLGVSTGNVGNWESQRSLPSNKSLGNIASKLSMSVGYLLGDAAPSPMELRETPPPYGLKKSAPGNVLTPTEMFQGKVPVVSYAAAGSGLNYSDLADQIDEWVSCDTSDPNAYALIIEGDSMEPEYKAGDRAVFLPNQEARNGDIVVARLVETGQVYFKLYHLVGPKADTVRLTSYNALYPPLEYPRKAFRFIHPLHGTWRPRKR